jgi:adenylate kinase
VIDSRSHAYILLGPPGSGKSTQADLFGREFGVAHIDIGASLRAAAGERTMFGDVLSEIINTRRELVPDNIIRSILENELRKVDPSRPVVIDGAPRCEHQIHLVLSVIHDSGRELRKVILIEVSEGESIARISKRFSCESCGRKLILWTDFRSVGDKCPSCGGAVTQRVDDTEAGVRERYRVFLEETLPVIAHFETQGELIRVSGDRSAEEIFAEIISDLKRV